MTVVEVTSLDQFDQIISQDQVTIFDFWAEWCGPCKFISPIFETLSNEFPSIGFYKIDVDSRQDISRKVGIRAMPTFIAFKGGDELNKLVGAEPEKLKHLIETISK